MLEKLSIYHMLNRDHTQLISGRKHYEK